MLMRALNRRLEKAGVNGSASVADPGLAATGVNIQHDLARTLGLYRRGIQDTKMFHDKAGAHAADAALPLALAALEGAPNALYVGEGGVSSTLEAAAHRSGHLLWGDIRRGDPMLWEDTDANRLWTQMSAILKAHKTRDTPSNKAGEATDKQEL